MKKISEVLRLHFKLNLPVRQSGKAAGVSRSVASRYCKRFEELNVSIETFISLNELQQEDSRKRGQATLFIEMLKTSQDKGLRVKK